jgi:hypothetical protein
MEIRNRAPHAIALQCRRYCESTSRPRDAGFRSTRVEPLVLGLSMIIATK